MEAINRERFKINANNIIGKVRPLKSVQRSKAIRTIPNFNDYMYKLEQNGLNIQILAEKMQNYCNSKNNRLIVVDASKSLNDEIDNHIKQTDIDKERLSSYSNLIDESKLRYNSYKAKKQIINDDSIHSILKNPITTNELKKTTDKLTKNDINMMFSECRQYILDYSSPTVILQASYLLSINAALALLSNKLDDDNDEFI